MGALARHLLAADRHDEKLTDRAGAFHKIAARAYLTEDEQIYFIDSLLEAALFLSDTTDVLIERSLVY